MEQGELALLAVVALLVVSSPSAVAVSTFVPIGKGLTQFGGIAFDHLTIEQNQSVYIQYAFWVNSSDLGPIYHPLLEYMTVDVTTPNGTQYTFSSIWHMTAWHYPEEFHGSTAQVGTYTVHLDMGGQVQQFGINVQDSQTATFTVVPKNVPSHFITPALSVLGLSIVALLGFGFLARLGLVSDRGTFSKLNSAFAPFRLLGDLRVLLPLAACIVGASYLLFPQRTIPIFVLSLMIVLAWVVQTAASLRIGLLLYRHYIGTFALYAFGYVSIAFHEGSHWIMNKMFGARILDKEVTPFGGFVLPEYSDRSFKTWFGKVFSAMAPAYLFPAVLLLIWLAFVGISFGVPYQPLHPDIYTPFNTFMITGIANFLYWVITNFANPMMYVFMYFLFTASLAAAPSEPRKTEEGWGGDWLYAFRAMKEMPEHTLRFVLAFFSIMGILALVDYDLVVYFFGFWFLLFLVVLTAQVIGLVFTRLTMVQGVVLLITAITLNVLAGYIITAWTPFIHQWQCVVNSSYC